MKKFIFTLFIIAIYSMAPAFSQTLVTPPQNSKMVKSGVRITIFSCEGYPKDYIGNMWEISSTISIPNGKTLATVKLVRNDGFWCNYYPKVTVKKVGNQAILTSYLSFLQFYPSSAYGEFYPGNINGVKFQYRLDEDLLPADAYYRDGIAQNDLNYNSPW